METNIGVIIIGLAEETQAQSIWSNIWAVNLEWQNRKRLACYANAMVATKSNETVFMATSNHHLLKQRT